MSFIYLKGEREPLEVSLQQARQVNSLWMTDPASKDIVSKESVGLGQSFKICDIRRIVGLETEKKYNYNDEELREFERTYQDWLDSHPHIVAEAKPFVFERWLYDLGYTREDGTIVDSIMWQEYQKKWTALRAWQTRNMSDEQRQKRLQEVAKIKEHFKW